MKKVIAFLRVSTIQQQLEGQREKAISNIIADGYKESEIFVIEGKESAIKLDEEERQTLNQLKDAITHYPDIKAVYVFAIDRLARRVSIVLSIKDYLLKRGINLIFLNPHKMGTMREENGVMVEDELTSMMLMFLSYGAEMEMKIKQARFAAAKAIMKEQGKAITGKVYYGYKVDEHLNVHINEEEAEIVRYVYKLFLDEKLSCMAIYKRLVVEGKWEHYGKMSKGYTRVRRILISDAYTGQSKKMNYPPIVSVELQEKAKAQLKQGICQPKSIQKHIYYGKGLVKYEGYTMVGRSGNNCYRADVNGATVALSINAIDTVLWERAYSLYTSQLLVNRGKMRKENEAKIRANQQNIEEIKIKIDKEQKKADKAFSKFVEGVVSDEAFEAVSGQIKRLIDDYKKEIARLESESAMLTAPMNVDDGFLTKKEDVEIDDETKQKIVKEVIDSLVVSKMGDGYRFDVISKIGKRLNKQSDWYYYYWSKGGVSHLYQCKGDERREIKIEKRYTRRR